MDKLLVQDEGTMQKQINREIVAKLAQSSDNEPRQQSWSKS